MKSRKLASRHRPARALALVGAVLLFSTCQDFFGTADLKQQIKDDVIDATAPVVTVNVAPPANPNMGAPSPVGSQSWKVGVPYTITTSVGDKYAFAGWTADAGDVTFGNAAETTTTFKVNAAFAGTITVTPNFDDRPKCIYSYPKSGGEYLNSSINFRFNEPVDPASLVLGDTIRITTWATGSGAIETPIENRFLPPDIDGYSVTLSLKSGSLYDPFHTVYITLTTGIRDQDGNGMADEFSWSFDTGNGTDQNSPAISSFAIRNQAQIEFAGSTAYTAEPQIKINVSATDDDGVRWLRIIETPCDSAGTALDGYSTITHPAMSYTGSTDFALASVSYEWTKITVQVADPSNNWSTASETAGNTKLVRLDTSPPAIPSVSSTNPNAYTGGTYWFRTGGVSFTLSSDDGDGSGILGYTTDPIGSDGFTPYPVSNPGISTSASLYAVDRAGNVSVPLPLSIQQDSASPTSCSLTSTTADYPSGTSASTYFDQSASISFQFSGADAQSGLAGFTTDSNGSSPAPTLLEVSIPAGTTRTVYAVDKVGNVLAGPTLTVKRDYTAPTIDSVASSNQDYVSGAATKTYWVNTTGKSVTFTLTVADTLDGSAAGSGIARVDYSGSGSGSIAASPYSATLSAGTYAFTARDNVGNTSAAANVIVKEDAYATPPTVTTNNSYDDPGSNTFWVKGSGTQAALTPAATDYAEAAQSSAGCGIASYHYSTHSNLSSPVTIGGSVNLGSGTYYFFTRDFAGNQSAAVTITVATDSAQPGTPACTPTGTYTTYTGSGIVWYAYSDALVPTFAVSATDPAPTSGIAGFSSDGSATLIPGLANGGTIILGTTAAVYYAVDNVGYISTNRLQVARDRTAPGMSVSGTAEFIQGTTYWVDTAAEKVTFTVTVSADTSDGTTSGSGVKRVYYGSTTLGTAAGTYSPSLGAGTYAIRAEDQVGNVTERTVTVSEDTQAPNITGASLTATATTISGFTTSDGTGSGLKVSSYTVMNGGSAAGTFDGSEMTISSGAPAAEGHTDYDIYVEDNVGHGTTVTVRLSRDDSDNYTAEIL